MKSINDDDDDGGGDGGNGSDGGVGSGGDDDDCRSFEDLKHLIQNQPYYAFCCLSAMPLHVYLILLAANKTELHHKLFTTCAALF